MFNTPAFLLYVLITTITPGPNNILSMSNAARVGLRRAMPFNLGILCGLGIMFGLCTALSAALYAWLPALALPMKCAGAAYMVYLAAKIYLSAPPREGGGDAAQQGMTFITGLTLQFVNMKIIVYGLTAMGSYILPAFTAPPILAGFAIFFTLTCFGANISWALFGSLFFKLFTRKQKLINTIMALLLLYCAASLFLT
jgi:threonine/homoserine/homoserine lactone efflux protein